MKGKIIKIEETWHKPNDNLKLEGIVFFDKMAKDIVNIITENTTEDIDYEVVQPKQIEDKK